MSELANIEQMLEELRLRMQAPQSLFVEASREAQGADLGPLLHPFQQRTEEQELAEQLRMAPTLDEEATRLREERRARRPYTATEAQVRQARYMEQVMEAQRAQEVYQRELEERMWRDGARWTEPRMFDARLLEPTRAERRQPMRVSARGDVLTAQEREALKICYTQLLTQGYGRWPLANRKVVVWIDGTARYVGVNDDWVIGSEQIYIGHSRARGTDLFADAGARLAVVVALLGVTGHAADVELQALLEAAIARVVVGTVEMVTKPLASRADSSPIGKMAWSASGGVAAWIDGEWCSPVSGEPVEVGEGWTIAETGDVATTLPVTELVIPPATQARGPRELWETWVGSYGWNLTALPDGRQGVELSGHREGDARDIELYNLTGCVSVQAPSGEWVITWPLETALVVESELARYGRERHLGEPESVTLDGRACYSIGDESYAQGRLAEIHGQGYRLGLAQIDPVRWGLCEPRESSVVPF